MAKSKASLEDAIEKALDGRTQTSIIEKMKDRGCNITDTQFSRKKKGREKFNEKELSVLSEILNVEL